MNWLDSLKVGDEVIVPYGWNESRCQRVTKATATQIHIGGTKYRRRNGRQIGTSGMSFIREATPELRMKVEEATMRKRLSEFEFKKLPIGVVRQVLAILEPSVVTQPDQP